MIIGGTSGDAVASPIAAAVDPRTRSWHLLRGLNGLGGFLPAGAVWNGHDVFLMGTLILCPEQGSACQDVRPMFLAYDPSTQGLRPIDLTSAPVGRHHIASLAPITWMEGEIVMARRDDPSAGLVFYDPGSDRWRAGSSAPCAVKDIYYTQTAWLGDRYVLPCGRDELQTYDPASDTWHVFTAGPSPMNSRAGSAIVWTGSELIAWSGTVRRVGNPTPNSGAAIALGG